MTLPLVFSSTPTSGTCSRCAARGGAQRGRLYPPEVGRARRSASATTAWTGWTRTSVVAFSERAGAARRATAPSSSSPWSPTSAVELYVEVGAERGPAARRAAVPRRRRPGPLRHARAPPRGGARLRTNGRLFNAWIDKSRADLALLTTPMQTGPYPYAGIPWFSTAFGRDGIITAWQILWFEPEPGQGRADLPGRAPGRTRPRRFRDSEPGKIMHETRRGEMAALGEVPFGRYYGGVDTTPLFVALAGAYAERTGDYAQLDQLVAGAGAGRRLDRHAAPIGTRWACIAYARGRGQRALQPGLEGQPATPSSTPTAGSPTGRSPWSRCRATPSPPTGPWRGSPRGAATRDAAERWTRPGRGDPRRPWRTRFWMADAGLLRHRPRRRGRALPGAAVQPRPPAVHRPAARPSRAKRVAERLFSARLLLGLGPADPGQRPAALQSDVLPQRLGLAARHGALRRIGLSPLRRARRAWCG